MEEGVRATVGAVSACVVVEISPLKNRSESFIKKKIYSRRHLRKRIDRHPLWRISLVVMPKQLMTRKS